MPGDTLVLDLPADAPAPGVRPKRGRLTENRVVFLVATVTYLGLAWWLWHSSLIPQDAISRVANGYYTLFSRDPHLAAVGAVWNPLPSLVLLPLLPVSVLVPALVRDGLVAAVVSAVSMAAAIAVCNDIFRRLRVPRAPRAALTAMLALHPMVFLYAGNGMSEALFLLLLALATRSLLRWFTEGRPERLVSLGVGVALAYGARYEALAPGLAAPVAVFLVSWWRGRHRPVGGPGIALTDAALVIFPIMVTVGLWAACGKIVVDQWFPTFSSEYGNATQVAASRADIDSVTGSSFDDRSAYAVRQLFGLEPLILPVLLAGAAMALLRRDVRFLAPVAVLAPVLVFDNLALLLGASFGWLRFQITAVPLVVLFVAIALAPRPGAVPAPPSDVAAPASPKRARGVLALAGGLLAVAVAIPSSVATLATPDLGREESAYLTASGAARSAYLGQLNLRIGQEIDALGLSPGSILTDSAYSYGVVLASRNPRQFVITSDRDFATILADPKGNRVRYFLVSVKGAADAVRVAYPNLDTTVPGSRVWSDDQGRALFVLAPV